MQKGTVLNLKNLRLTEFFRENNILVILFLFMLAGITIGIFTESKFSLLSNYADTYIKSFISDRTDETFFSITSKAFMSSMLALLIVFAAGTSMLGVIIVPLTVTFRCLLYGAISAYLYSAFSVKGIAFNAVLIIPSVIIFVIALLLAARESVKFSLIIVRMFLPHVPAINLSFDFKNYCGRYIFITLIALLSALTDGVLSSSFLQKLTL